MQNHCFRMNFSGVEVPEGSLIKLNLIVDNTVRKTLTVNINKRKWHSNYFILIAIHMSGLWLDSCSIIYNNACLGYFP